MSPFGEPWPVAAQLDGCPDVVVDGLFLKLNRIEMKLDLLLQKITDDAVSIARMREQFARYVGKEF